MSVDDPALAIKHLRQMGSSHKSVYHGRRRWGMGQYFMGTHPLYLLGITGYRMLERPWVLGGLNILFGYAGAWMSRQPRYEEPGFRPFLHDWQLKELKHRMLGIEDTTTNDPSCLASRSLIAQVTPLPVTTLPPSGHPRYAEKQNRIALKGARHQRRGATYSWKFTYPKTWNGSSMTRSAQVAFPPKTRSFAKPSNGSATINKQPRQPWIRLARSVPCATMPGCSTRSWLTP